MNSKPLNSLAGCLMALTGACSSPHPNSGQSSALPATGSGERMVSSDSGISGLAAREVVRRQEAVRRADRAALEANRASAEGDHEAAIRSYRQALDTLPAED